MNLYSSGNNANGSNYDACVYVTERLSIILFTPLESYSLNFEQHLRLIEKIRPVPS